MQQDAPSKTRRLELMYNALSQPKAMLAERMRQNATDMLNLDKQSLNDLIAQKLPNDEDKRRVTTIIYGPKFTGYVSTKACRRTTKKIDNAVMQDKPFVLMENGKWPFTAMENPINATTTAYLRSRQEEW